MKVRSSNRSGMVHSQSWIRSVLALFLDLPPYMQIYSVVNVENLKLYEPPMIMDEDENVQVPSIDHFALVGHCMNKMYKMFVFIPDTYNTS